MKQYPRIPHLPGSQGTEDDRDAGRAFAARCTEAAGAEDRVLITEKLDGTCVAIARLDGELVALGREGRRCEASRNRGRRAFAAWVAAQPARWAPLRDGERVILEWLALTHGVRYQLPHEPAVVLDLFDARGRRPLDEARRAAARLGLPSAAQLSDGPARPIAEALAALGPRGRHGATDPPEGLVYRVERRRDGAVLGQAKYVRPGLERGRYLEDRTGLGPVWNDWSGPWTLADALRVAR